MPPLVILGATARMASNAFLAKLEPLVLQAGMAAEYWGWQREETPQDLSPEAGLPVRILFRGGGEANRKLLLYYPRWMAAVFFQALKAPVGTRFFCINFDTAFPLAIASLFRARPYLFANLDNISLSYRWPKPIARLFQRLEGWIARRARVHVLPGESRWPTRDANAVIVRNTPSAVSVERAKALAQARGYTRSETLTLYVNGWLTGTRGMGTLDAALERIPSGRVQILMAGAKNCPEVDRLLERPEVEYVGVVSEEEALALYERAHLVFTFYDPRIAINRVAEPNKWGDCMVTQTPFVANAEVETARSFLAREACFVTPYDDPDALAALLMRLADDREAWQRARDNLASFSAAPWDQEMRRTLEGFQRGE